MQDYPQMAAGALLVAVLAVLVDIVLIGGQRLVVSRGLTGRYARATIDTGRESATATNQPSAA